jgi:phage terminase small subunit
MPGPAPKPTAIRILEGNPGKRPIRGDEPKPRRAVPPCPRWLAPEARREWRSLGPELARIGLLTVVDGPIFALFCQSFARFQQAETDGDLAKVKAYAPLMRAAMSELGLTPAARARLAVAPAPPSDPMEALLD